MNLYFIILCSCKDGNHESHSSMGISTETHTSPPFFDDCVIIDNINQDSIIVTVKQVELINTDYKNIIINQIIAFLLENDYSKEYNIIVMHFSSKGHQHVSFYIKNDIGDITYAQNSILCGFDVAGYHFLVYDDLDLSTYQKQSLFLSTSRTKQFILGLNEENKKDGGPEWVYFIDDSLNVQSTLITEKW